MPRSLTCLRFLAVLCVCLWSAYGCSAQEDQTGALFLSVSGGVVSTAGSFAGNGHDEEPLPGMILGTATIGSGFQARATYYVYPRLGLYAMALTTSNGASKPSRYRFPWECQNCGLGYVAPNSTMSSMEIGNWRSTMAMVGLELDLGLQQPHVTARAAIGYQSISSPAVVYKEEGTQLVNTGAPPFVTLGYIRSFEQPSVTTYGTVFNIGLDLRQRLAARLHLLFGVDLVLGQVRFKGIQTVHFDGATQGDPDEHYETQYTFDQVSGTTRLLWQIGLCFEVLRGRDTPKPIAP